MTKLLSQHFRCTVLGIYYLWLYSCSLIAWPRLSCVYCTGKASGWFFRHKMSDLFPAAAMRKGIASNYSAHAALMHRLVNLDDGIE